MNDEAWDKKLKDAAEGAMDGSANSLGERFGGMLAACVKTLRDELRAKHRTTDERLTAIEEHLTAIREGRE